jgi:hypothetical protein
MSIEMVPFEAGLDAEIRGVDIRARLSADDATRSGWPAWVIGPGRGFATVN